MDGDGACDVNEDEEEIGISFVGVMENSVCQLKPRREESIERKLHFYAEKEREIVRERAKKVYLRERAFDARALIFREAAISNCARPLYSLFLPSLNLPLSALSLSFCAYFAFGFGDDCSNSTYIPISLSFLCRRVEKGWKVRDCLRSAAVIGGGLDIYSFFAQLREVSANRARAARWVKGFLTSVH